jgi:Predicted membrane protein
MMGWNGGMMGGYGIGLGIIGWLVQMGLIVALVYFVFILVRKATHSSTDNNQAEQILKERFARGEISQEEYQKMKEILH